jgi:dTDP-4-dehydrorhamnose reductase
MRVLILGASGMLGHRMVKELAGLQFNVMTACRRPGALPDLGVAPDAVLGGLDAQRAKSAIDIIRRLKPDAVVNCVGIVKQRAAAHDPVPSIQVNSLFPHVVSAACREVDARFLQISTDCVFAGNTGGYTEADVPDATDLYGRSKLLGEVIESRALTLRTSIVGWEIGEAAGLLGWFEGHRAEPLSCFSSAFFSGLTTTALSRVIAKVLRDHPTLNGLYHVSAERIDKCSLLRRLAGELRWDVDLIPTNTPCIDRSLDSGRFRARTGWSPAPWSEMLAALAAEHEWYAAFRRSQGW